MNQTTHLSTWSPKPSPNCRARPRRSGIAAFLAVSLLAVGAVALIAGGTPPVGPFEPLVGSDDPLWQDSWSSAEARPCIAFVMAEITRARHDVGEQL
jgi:hypothetical protein